VERRERAELSPRSVHFRAFVAAAKGTNLFRYLALSEIGGAVLISRVTGPRLRDSGTPDALSIRALVETRESPLERTLSASSASRRISHRDVGPRRPVAVLMTTQFANFANAGASCRSRSTFDPRTLRSVASTSGEPVSSRAIRATPRMNFFAAPRLNSPPRRCRSSGRWSGISRDHEKSNF